MKKNTCHGYECVYMCKYLGLNELAGGVRLEGLHNRGRGESEKRFPEG